VREDTVSGKILENEVVANSVTYERPELVSIGSLHDLLAGTTGSQCDNGRSTTNPMDDGTC
jgi:hypothetical protein